MSQRAEKALHRITSQPARDAVIDCWLEDRASETALQIIEEQSWRHSDEARWLKFIIQRNCFAEHFIRELAPQVTQPAIARVRLHSEAANATEAASMAVAADLGQISAQAAVDILIDCWLEGKAGDVARQVIEEQGWRHSQEARWIEFLYKRNHFDQYFVAELAPLANTPPVARMLAHPEGANASQAAAAAAAAALQQISAQEAVDAVIDCWIEDKAGETTRQIIEEQHWQHTDEAQWLKFLTKRNRFDEYFVTKLGPLVNQPVIARMLASPEGTRGDQAAAAATAVALRQISAQEAIDTVIDCWLEDKSGETALQVIEELSWRHSDEARWFLYLVTRGRFDEYLAEDYEFDTLRPEFLAAPAALKARIREAVIKAGEVRMNSLFLAGKRAPELTVADAEALVRTNIRTQNWKVLVDNFWWFPARQTLHAVQAIAAAKWQPDDAAQAALLARLGALAQILVESTTEEPGTVPLNPVYQKWLTSGETGPLSRKSPADLKALLNDETDPPDQIAAMGALRKQGELDAATMAKAGLSEHWMVRWVAVHFGADLTLAMQVNDAGIEWFRRLAIIRNLDDAGILWTAKPCEVTRDGLEALREHLARLPDPRTAGGLLLVEAICTHYTSHDIEVEEGIRVVPTEDSFELEG